MEGKGKVYRAFYDRWMATHDAPPSSADFSSDKRDRVGFYNWARRNCMPLTRFKNVDDDKFRKFYDNWIATHGAAPRVYDYSENQIERNAFRSWAKREDLALANRNPKDTQYLIRLANKIEPLRNAGLTRRQIANTLGVSINAVVNGIWLLIDDPTDVEDDPRACEPPEVKTLCDQLRARDCIPPRLLPEQWPRYLQVRSERMASEFVNPEF